MTGLVCNPFSLGSHKAIHLFSTSGANVVRSAKKVLIDQLLVVHSLAVVKKVPEVKSLSSVLLLLLRVVPEMFLNILWHLHTVFISYTYVREFGSNYHSVHMTI